MEKIKVFFSECEHHGDLDNYKDDVRKAGGKVIGGDVDLDEEEGYVLAEVQDYATFKTEFQKTDSVDFCLGFSRVK